MTGCIRSSRKILMTKSTIRDKRRARRGERNIVSNEKLYETFTQEPVEETPEYVQEIQMKAVERKRFRQLIGAEYDYETMANKYSETNVAQQLGNYRQAMEFLAHCTLPKTEENDKIVDKLKTTQRNTIKHLHSHSGIVLHFLVVKSLFLSSLLWRSCELEL